MEFCPKILEKQENLNKEMFFVKVREFYTKCWKISGFEKITVSRSYLILFSQTSQVSWHLFLLNSVTVLLETLMQKFIKPSEMQAANELSS